MGVLSFRDRLRPRHWMTIGILLGVAVLVCILFFNDPEAASWYPPCVFHKSTELYCFGCGNTRALYHLIHGDIPGSLRKNLLLVPACLFLFCALVKPQWLNRPAVLYVAAGVIVVFTVLRNLPWEPFCLLAPR